MALCVLFVGGVPLAKLVIEGGLVEWRSNWLHIRSDAIDVDGTWLMMDKLLLACLLRLAHPFAVFTAMFILLFIIATLLIQVLPRLFNRWLLG